MSVKVGDIVPLILPLADLVGELLKRAAQSGELTTEQRQKLREMAAGLFEAASVAPPPPPPPPAAKPFLHYPPGVRTFAGVPAPAEPDAPFPLEDPKP